MQIAAAYPSEFLKAADLQGHEVTVTIDRVEMRDIGSDHKPVLFFEGKEKGLVLNKTNAGSISSDYGGETDDWTGKQIILYPVTTQFQGQTVPAIRVRTPLKTALDDEVPF